MIRTTAGLPLTAGTGMPGLVLGLALAFGLVGAGYGQSFDPGDFDPGDVVTDSLKTFDDIEAPVIAAPEDPGRTVPADADRFQEFTRHSFNGFAAGDMPPPLDDLASNFSPVVVELFTSQGCSSCPPADAMMGRLAQQPDVLPLSYHVDYWDYLGWADSFARPEFSRRQKGYARVAGERGVYTPQMIVDGQDTAVAPGPAQLTGLIDANRLSPALVTIQRDTTPRGDQIEVLPLSDLGGKVDVMLIRYAPERRIKIKEGENRGREMTYTNVVLSLTRLADWDGKAPLRLTISPDGIPDDRFPPDTRHVILVQREMGPKGLPGPILAAISLD